MAAFRFLERTKHLKGRLAAFRHQKAGKNNNGILILVLVGVFIFFASQQLNLFTTFETMTGCSEVQQLTSLGRPWEHRVCSPVLPTNVLNFGVDALNLGGGTSNGGLGGNLRTKLSSDWVSYEVKVNARAELVVGSGLNNCNGGASGNIGSSSFSSGGYVFSKTCSELRDGLPSVFSLNGLIIRGVRTSSGAVDLYAKKCETCPLEFVQNQPSDGYVYFAFGVSANSANDPGGAAKVSLNILSFAEVTESGVVLDGFASEVPLIPVECSVNADCWALKKSCGYGCYRNKCEISLTTSQEVLCADNKTLVGGYPVCSTGLCPVAVIDANGSVTFEPVIVPVPVVTGEDDTSLPRGEEPEDEEINSTLLIIGGVVGFLVLLRFLR